MASAGQEIHNRLTGERIVFRTTAAETGGELLVFDTHWPRPGHRAAEHIHPEIEERFTVLGGMAALRIDGTEQMLRKGDSLAVAPGTPHLAWNPSDAPVHLRLEFRPALRWEDFTERLFTISSEEIAVSAGAPDIARLTELLREFQREIILP